MESGSSSRPLRLADLPDGLLSLILGQFCMHCREPHPSSPPVFRTARQERGPRRPWYGPDCQALYSACLVSRRFQDIAQPILYHQFATGVDADSRFTRQHQFSGRLAPFLRTVARRPDLAAQVRRLPLSQLFMHFAFCDQTELPPALDEAARARGSQLTGFLCPFTLSRLGTSRPDTRPLGPESATMLLALLPNLNHVSIADMPNWYAIPLPALRTARLSSIPIHVLDILDRPTQSREGALLDLASSTSQTLNIHRHHRANLGALARPLPNLRNLSITSHMDTPGGVNDLAHFLFYHTKLESFFYEALDIVGFDTYLSSGAISHLLANRHTLQTLHLDVRLASDAGLVSKGAERTRGNEPVFTELVARLPEFSMLRHLFLNIYFLYDYTVEWADDVFTLCRVLPTSIVSLKLADNLGMS